MTFADLKLVAAVLIFVGIGLNFIVLRYAQSAILLEQSTNPSPWLKWGAWAVSSLAAIAYIALDYLED